MSRSAFLRPGISFLRNFKEHPESVGETYTQHFKVAARFSVLLGYAAFAAIVHAFIPSLFESTSSRIIKKLHSDMMNRHK